MATSMKQAGFASLYLHVCWNARSLKNEADIDMYCELMRLDSKFGTKESHQLYKCVEYCLQLEIIKVSEIRI